MPPAACRSTYTPSSQTHSGAPGPEHRSPARIFQPGFDREQLGNPPDRDGLHPERGGRPRLHPRSLHGYRYAALLSQDQDRSEHSCATPIRCRRVSKAERPRSAAGAALPSTSEGAAEPRSTAVPPSGYSRRRDRSPRRCCRTVPERFHLTRLRKRVVRVRHTVDARAPSSPRGHTDATVASSCTPLAHRLLVG